MVSLKTRLTITLLGLVAIPLIIVAIIIALQVYHRQHNNAINLQSQIVKRIGVEITAFLNLLENDLDVAINIHGIDEHDDIELLQSLIGYESQFERLTLVDYNGNILADVNRRVSGDTAVNLDALAAVQNGEVYYSPVRFDDQTGEPLMTIALPIPQRATLIAEARIKSIWDILEQYPQDVYIVDEQNRVIAHRTPSVVLRGTIFKPPAQNGVTTGLNQETVLLTATTIRFGDQEFTIIVEASTAETLAPALQAALSVALVAGIALIAAMILGVVAVNDIVRPVTALAEAARAISTGDLNQYVAVQHHDEIGDLAQAFNTMSNQLKTTLNELEERVLTRTRDLQLAADVSKQITTVLDIDNLLQQVAGLVVNSFGLDAVFIFLLEDQILYRAAGRDKDERIFTKSSEICIPLDKTPSIIALSAREQRLINVPDISDSKEHLLSPEIHTTRSELAVPMHFRDALVGILDAQSATPNHFTHDHERIFTTLAEQIAIAIRNAQLYTDSIAARKEAERSNQVKSQFLAAMSHELRTPMNAVLNFTEFVASGMIGTVNDRQEEMLRKVIKSGEHLLSLINDVLDISKIEAGAMELFIETNISIKATLETAIASARSMLNEGVVLKVEYIEPLPLIEGDSQRIMQIVLNLLSNACKFTEEGTVTLRVYAEDKHMIITVGDTGYGIPPEDQEMIFDSFHQAEMGKRKGTGTGLGLPISRKLTEAHGGTLTLKSTPNIGSTFTVRLPIHQKDMT